MREVINISLPSAMAKSVRRAVRSGNYASISEFFRDLLRTREESRLYKDVLISEREFVQGKGKKLTSFKELR